MMEDKAYKYARNLLFEICRRDCPEKEVEALDDTIGVLTQIDHMTAHLFSRIEALIAERDEARDAALEEAAKVADECFKQNYLGRRDLYNWGIASGAQAIAAAIRALKGKSHE